MGVIEDKNKQIIEAAIAEFQERGFAGASMDRISERANVSKRTVYNHFESKEALFREINQCLADRLTAALDLSLDPDAPIRDELTRLAWAEGDLLLDPCFMGMARMILSETIRNPELAEEMNSRTTKAGTFEEFLAEAARRGKLRLSDPKQAAAEFLGLIKAQGFYPNLYSAQPVSRDEMGDIIERAVEMILNTYGVAEAGTA